MWKGKDCEQAVSKVSLNVILPFQRPAIKRPLVSECAVHFLSSQSATITKGMSWGSSLPHMTVYGHAVFCGAQRSVSKTSQG